jgi:hypothetical protein
VTMVATGWGLASRPTSLLGAPQAKAWRRRRLWAPLSLLGASCPPAISFAGENPVHPWTSDDGALDVITLLKASMWNLDSVTMSCVTDALRSRRPVNLFFDGWVCFGRTTFAVGRAGGHS